VARRRSVLLQPARLARRMSCTVAATDWRGTASRQGAARASGEVYELGNESRQQSCPARRRDDSTLQWRRVRKKKKSGKQRVEETDDCDGCADGAVPSRLVSSRLVSCRPIPSHLGPSRTRRDERETGGMRPLSPPGRAADARLAAAETPDARPFGARVTANSHGCRLTISTRARCSIHQAWRRQGIARHTACLSTIVPARPTRDWAGPVQYKHARPSLSARDGQLSRCFVSSARPAPAPASASSRALSLAVRCPLSAVRCPPCSDATLTTSLRSCRSLLPLIVITIRHTFAIPQLSLTARFGRPPHLASSAVSRLSLSRLHLSSLVRRLPPSSSII
jgi:hypothetical protein